MCTLSCVFPKTLELTKIQSVNIFIFNFELLLIEYFILSKLKLLVTLKRYRSKLSNGINIYVHFNKLLMDNELRQKKYFGSSPSQNLI